MPDGCDDLLEQARVVYRGATECYRDALLETGRLLHRFVLSSLQGGDGVPDKRRQRTGFTRAAAVKKAAAALGATIEDVSRLIAVAMAAGLLADEAGVGPLAWNTVGLFVRFVRRKNGRKHPGRDGDPVSDCERWELRREYDGRAVNLFRKAVRAGMNYEEVRPAALALYATVKAPRRTRRPPRRQETALQVMRAAAAIASPGDLADTLFDLLTQAQDPVATATLLLSRARTWAKERQQAERRSLYEAG
jgi:hypothetical protein